MRSRFALPVVLVVLAALGAVPARAQWLPAGPTSATPRAFAANSRAVFAADVAARTVHRSTDDGRTWQNASPPVTGAGTTPTINGLAASDGGVAALVRNSSTGAMGFHRSTTDGATWTRVATLPTTQFDYEGLVVTRSGAFATIGIEPSTFARRLFVSTNNGATWTRRDSLFRASNQVIAVGDTLIRAYERTKRRSNGAFYSELGVAVSVDLGVSWTERAAPDCFSSCQAVAASNDARLLDYGGGRLFFSGYVSSDFGLTWSTRPVFNGTLLRYAVGGTRVVVASGSGTSAGFGLFADTTGAGAWRDVSARAGLNDGLRREVFWTGRSFLVGLEFGGVVRSVDGITWAPAGRFAAHHNNNVVALTVHRGTLVAGLGNERIVRSDDRGATWHHDHLRLPSLDDAAGFVSLDSVVLAGGQEGIYRTTDLRTWTRISTGLTNVDGFVRVGGRLYAGATTGLYQRPASGTTWTQVLNHNLNQFDVGLAGNRLIVNGGNGTVRSLRISLDGGQTWPASIPSRPALQVAATSRAFVTATTNFSFFGGGTFERSLDDGATWQNLKPALGDSLAPTLLDNRGDTLIAIGATYFAASLDHGTTWRRVPHTGLGFTFGPGTETNAPVALTRMGDTVYVAFANNGVWKRSLADLGFVTDAPAAPRAATAALSVAPNPARGPAAVTLTLGAPGPARVAVYDALGREVAVLHDGPLGAGTHRLMWADAAPPGLYIVRLDGPDGATTRPLIRVR